MNTLAHSTSRLGQTLRMLREQAGLSISGLARITDLSKTSISNIEMGSANPSLETMWRLAGALGVTLGTLLGERSSSAPHVIRSHEGAAFAAASGVRGRILSTTRREHRAEVLELVFEGAIEHESLAHVSGAEEFLICTEGSIEAGPIGEEVLLQQGDAVWFSGDRQHRYVTTAPARAILLMIYPAGDQAILGAFV